MPQLHSIPFVAPRLEFCSHTVIADPLNAHNLESDHVALEFRSNAFVIRIFRRNGLQIAARLFLVCLGHGGCELRAPPQTKKKKKLPHKKSHTQMKRGRRAEDRNARIARARTQRLFFVDHIYDEAKKATKMTFKVMGTTGNLYDVTLFAKQKWKCRCPDFTQRLLPCKHIYFVCERVLGESKLNVEDIWGKALERWRRNSLAVADAAALAPEVYRERYLQLTGGVLPDVALGVPQRECQGQDCAICMEPMSEPSELVYCKRVCGNSVHTVCFQIWSKQHPQAPCPMCRAPMTVPSDEPPSRPGRKYLNLDV